MILKDPATVQFEVGIDEIDTIVEYLSVYLGEMKTWLFHGELGSGKTYLIQALLSAMGVQDPVSSPTYSIVNEYMGKDEKPIYHLDLYRLKTQREALDIGILEYLDSNYLCLIEWPELVSDLLPQERVEIMINHVSKDIRQYSINHYE